MPITDVENSDDLCEMEVDNMDIKKLVCKALILKHEMKIQRYFQRWKAAANLDQLSKLNILQRLL